jgi:hypothetical protein
VSTTERAGDGAYSAGPETGAATAPSGPTGPTAIAPLAALLAARGLTTSEPLFALRTTLDPRDASDDHRTTADLATAGHERVYARMQEGLRLGSGRAILCFLGEAGGRARFCGFRRFMARRPGVVPGDIVYDYDVADLFHQFVSRSRRPVFYDALDLPGLDDLIGHLVVEWPKPAMLRLRPADHPALLVVDS